MGNRSLEITERLAAIGAQIGQLQAERTALQNEFASMKCPFKPGDKVKFRRGVSMAQGIVTSVRYAFMDRHDLLVQRILKDGSLGAVITVYSYDRPEKVSEA